MLFKLAVAGFALLPTVSAHGYMTCPLPRMYRDDPIPDDTWTNWMGIVVPGSTELSPGEGNAPNFNSAIGGGPDGATKETEVGHTLCGDVVRPAPDGPAFMAGHPVYGPTIPRGIYKSGGIMDVNIKLTAYHYGWFEFRLCVPAPANQGLDTKVVETQACMNQHILQIDPSSENYADVIKYDRIDGSYRCPLNGDTTASNPSTVWPDGTCCKGGGNAARGTPTLTAMLWMITWLELPLSQAGIIR